MKTNQWATIFIAFLFCFCLFTGSLCAQSKTNCALVPWLSSGPGSGLVEVDIDEESHRSLVKPDNFTMGCSLYNFDLFFQLFSEDLAFQRSATIFPLKVTYIEPNFEAEGDDSDIIETVTFLKPADGSGNASVFPSRQQRISANLGYFIDDNNPISGANYSVSVILRREGTGIHYEFAFIWDGCWFLSEVIDSST